VISAELIMEDKELIYGMQANFRDHMEGLRKEMGAIHNKIEETEKNLSELKEQKERKEKNWHTLCEGVEGAHKACLAVSLSEFLKKHPEFG
jgi:predicted  nucleic acid-binding Zn-ribbon protein